MAKSAENPDGHTESMLTEVDKVNFEDWALRVGRNAFGWKDYA